MSTRGRWHCERAGAGARAFGVTCVRESSQAAHTNTYHCCVQITLNLRAVPALLFPWRLRGNADSLRRRFWGGLRWLPALFQVGDVLVQGGAEHPPGMGRAGSALCLGERWGGHGVARRPACPGKETWSRDVPPVPGALLHREWLSPVAPLQWGNRRSPFPFVMCSSEGCLLGGVK